MANSKQTDPFLVRYFWHLMTALIIVCVIFMIQYGLKPRIIPVIRPSNFNSKEQLIQVISQQLQRYFKTATQVNLVTSSKDQDLWKNLFQSQIDLSKVTTESIESWQERNKNRQVPMSQMEFIIWTAHPLQAVQKQKECRSNSTEIQDRIDCAVLFHTGKILKSKLDQKRPIAILDQWSSELFFLFILLPNDSTRLAAKN